MKNVKRIFGIAILMAIVASFSVGCKVQLSDNQEAVYIHFISGIQREASRDVIKAEDVKKMVEEYNKEFEIWGIKVTDKEAGKDIAKGTKAKELKTRFPVSKI